MIIAHRPAQEWLSDLQKAKFDGSSGLKPRITIADLVEKVNDPKASENQLIPTSPRSVEACFRLGIDPVDLQYHPLAYFRKLGETEEASRVRYEKYEAVRQDRIRLLIDKRKELLDSGAPENHRHSVSAMDAKGENNSSAMVEKEKNRLDVLKRRQERELNQMVQHELARKELAEKQQKKMEAMEVRTKEMQRLKAQHDAEWIAHQRELSLKKAREEEQSEREARRLAEERYKREQIIMQQQMEEEKRRRKEAWVKDMERRQKSEEARKATEAILNQQMDEVAKKRVEMDKRDAERLKRLEIEMKERMLANIDKRKKAEQRLTSALQANTEILNKRRQEFQRREGENEQRRIELEDARRRMDEMKRQEEMRKSNMRASKYALAAEREEARKQNFLRQSEEKEAALTALASARKRENDIRRAEREVQLNLRLDKVDSIQKMNLYQRQQLFEKIMGEYDLARNLMAQKQSLQTQRKMTNMAASLQRQMVNQVMERLVNTKDLNKLQNNGAVNLNALLGSRPGTANF